MSPSVSVRLLQSQSDERLVGYARAGHERAFEALVQRYRRQLLSYCRRLLLSDQRAEDALQQALLQAWVALRGGSEVSEPRAWLYRIVHNAAVNTLRTTRYDYCQLSESLSGADAPQADLDRRIAVREALAGLAALPEMQREALLRTAVEGRTHQQTAAELGLSEPAVRGLVYRARASLRGALGAIVPPPLIGWALDAGTRGTPVIERVAGVAGAGGGSAGLAGLIVKGGAVAVTAGALAGGIVATHAHSVSHRHHRLATPRRAESSQAADAATARPVSFTRSDGSRLAAQTRHTGARAPSTPRSEARRSWPQRAFAPPATHRTAPVHDSTGQTIDPLPPPGERPRRDGGVFEPASGSTSGDRHSGPLGGSSQHGGGGDEPQGTEPKRDSGGDGSGGGSGSSQGGESSGGDGGEPQSNGGESQSGESGGYKDHQAPGESTPQQDH